MNRLILLRHAKAEIGSPGGQDRLRSLTRRGQDDARNTAKTLLEHNIDIDLALVSPATRCLHTWKAIEPGFPECQWQIEPDLYLASADELFALAENQHYNSVMLVAHNPGLHELALTLCPGGHPLAARLMRKFPTSAIAVFDSDPTGNWDVHKILFKPDQT